MSDNKNEFLIPSSLPVRELNDKLKLRFPVRDGGSVRLVRHYQDTFDWRLYRKSCCYFVDETPQTLTLNCIAPNKSLQLVTTGMPVFARDFTSAEFRRLVAPLVNIRALMTHVALQVNQTHLYVVDDEDKTRVNIYIEHARLTLPGKPVRNLGKRLRLEPVRGYEKSADEIRRYLVDEWRLRESDVSEFRAACEYLGIDPGETAPELTLSPDMRTDEALKQMLLSALDTMENNIDGAIKNIDSEFLHDLRVATRRTRSILSLIQQVFPRRILDRFEKGFAWIGDITGPTRDMDVYLLKFDSYRQSLPRQHRQPLDALHGFLEKHQRMEQQQLAASLQSPRFRQLLRDWRTFLQQPVPVRSPLENAMQAVKVTADVHIWKAYKKVMKRGSAITHRCPDEKLHRLRISCKKLRYLMDFFQCLYPKGKFKSMLKTLKGLQDVLGDFQDLSVQIERLEAFEGQMQEESMLDEATHAAMQCLVKQLGGNIKQQRQLFYQQFKLFSTATMQAGFQSLFHATEPSAKQ